MDIEALQKLVKDFPAMRCMLCSRLKDQNMLGLPTKPYCDAGLTPPCGRNFNPKQGGDQVPA